MLNGWVGERESSSSRVEILTIIIFTPTTDWTWVLGWANHYFLKRFMSSSAKLFNSALRNICRKTCFVACLFANGFWWKYCQEKAKLQFVCLYTRKKFIDRYFFCKKYIVNRDSSSRHIKDRKLKYSWVYIHQDCPKKTIFVLYMEDN